MSAAFEWPDGRAGAVSLTFDDGHPSQLDAAIPIMNSLSMAGTFYVNPPADYVEWLKPWREARRQGHEIGNHTVQHICSRNFGFRADGTGLETVTLETIEADILDAQARLREGIPEQSECTFCYPCAQTFVGEGASRQSYVPVAARHFIAARGIGEWANHPALCDLLCLSSYDCRRMSGAEMFGLAEQAAAQGRWAIMTFHGVGSGHLSVGASDFRELCEALNRHRDRIWTAPVIEVAKHIRQWRASS